MAITAGTLSLVAVGYTTASLASTEATAGTGPYTYQWYRSTVSAFTPAIANAVAGATSLTLLDAGLVTGTQYYYKVVATDTGAGNATAEYTQLPTLTLTTLRASYTGSLNSKLTEARQAGHDFIAVTNLAALITAMNAAAARGQTKFTVNFPVTYQPADLRGATICGISSVSKCGCGRSATSAKCTCGRYVNSNGPLWPAFETGIYQALANQDIIQNEVWVSLNTSDQIVTSIDLNFNF